MSSPIIVREVSRYLAWCRDFEARRPGHGDQAWYQSAIVGMYTRVHPREAGGLELALANIVVVDAWRGHGFLTLLLERMLHQDCGLISHWLRLERVRDPQLVRRLLTTGFLVDAASDMHAPHLVVPLPAPAGG